MSRALTLALAATFFAALLAAHTGHRVCRIVVTDDAGDVYIAGQGDTLRDAWQGAEMPSAWRTITFPGCYATR